MDKGRPKSNVRDYYDKNDVKVSLSTFRYRVEKMGLSYEDAATLPSQRQADMEYKDLRQWFTENNVNLIPWVIFRARYNATRKRIDACPVWEALNYLLRPYNQNVVDNYGRNCTKCQQYKKWDDFRIKFRTYTRCNDCRRNQQG